MKISEDTVRQVAKLARLAVSEDEARRLAPQLSDIIGYAEQLQQVDLTNVEMMSHPFSYENVLRQDAVRQSIPRDVALANAPDDDGEQVRVPAVMEG